MEPKEGPGPRRIDRRRFLGESAAVAAALGLPSCGGLAHEKEPLFRISLAQWSLHRRLLGRQEPRLDPLDFPREARSIGIEAVEYVNTFYSERVREAGFLDELKRRAQGEGVRSLLIMCDREGALGDPDEAKRARAVQNHEKWLEAARLLGCHSIRVNAASAGSPKEQARLAADGLRKLCETAEPYGLNVLVENHGGLSSDGSWLAGVIRAVGRENCGTLPDFGNFRVSADREYDRYRGVEELMPFAMAVSAKSHDFDEDGNEIHTDFRRMMRIVLAAGYRGWVGIEYEGPKLDENAGTLATKRLLERVREELAA